MNNMFDIEKELNNVLPANTSKSKEIFEETNQSLKAFRYSIVVNANEFKNTALDIEAVLHKSTMGNAVRFKIINNKLEISCMNKAYYKSILNLEGQTVDNAEIVVVYKAVSKMIPEDCDIKIAISPVGVEIITPISEIVLLNNIANVQDVKVENHGFVAFNDNIVKQGLKTLLSTTAIINTIGTGVNISMTGKYMNCKYATVYIECPSQGVENNITRELARMLTTFLYGDTHCYIANSSTTQIFKKGNRYLAIPYTKIESTSVTTLIKEDMFKAKLSIPGLYDRVKNIVQAYGNGIAKVDFYTNMVVIERSDAGYRLKSIVGSKSEFLFSIEVNLEHFRDVLHVIGDSFKLYQRGENACLISLDNHVSII